MGGYFHPEASGLASRLIPDLPQFVTFGPLWLQGFG